MIVHNLDLWKYIKENKDALVPTEYWPYKTGPVGSSIVATEDDHSGGKSGEVTRLVKELHAKTRETAGLPIDNKTAVMCIVSPAEGVGLPVYFVMFDLTYTICTEIQSDHKEPILIREYLKE